MYMAPLHRTDAAPSRPLTRAAVGVPVLTLAAVVMLPWVAINALVAGVVLTGRFGMQAVDYAGQVALGR